MLFDKKPNVLAIVSLIGRSATFSRSYSRSRWTGTTGPFCIRGLILSMMSCYRCQKDLEIFECQIDAFVMNMDIVTRPPQPLCGRRSTCELLVFHATGSGLKSHALAASRIPCAVAQRRLSEDFWMFRAVLFNRRISQPFSADESTTSLPHEQCLTEFLKRSYTKGPTTMTTSANPKTVDSIYMHPASPQFNWTAA